MGATGQEKVQKGMSTEELVRKAIITADELATGGKLNDVQSDRFIDYVIDETTLKGVARVERFRAENMNIDKIGVGRRATVPAAEASDPKVRFGISTDRVTLTPVEVMTPFEISDTFKEHVIEGQSVEETVIRLMATRAANDYEELMINGDALGPAALEGDVIPDGSASLYIKDSFLALFNGWLRQADAGHLVDWANEKVNAQLFSKCLNAMPRKFKRQRQLLRYFASHELDQNYREKMAQRATAVGDTALNSNAAMSPFGVPIAPVALLPGRPTVTKHVVLNGTTPATLGYKPIVDGSVVVVPAALSRTPTAAYIEDTDYTVDYTNGTVVRKGGTAIGDGATVKVTFQAGGQLLLTPVSNLIMAIGREITIERQRDIYKRVNQFAITTKIHCVFEEVDAVVKAFNIDMEEQDS